MSNQSIEKLLLAQKIDKERLQLLQNLENGKVKKELDKTTKLINNSRTNVLQLDSDAKVLQENYQKISKIIAETLALVEKTNANQNEDLELYSNYLSKLSMLESQLADIERRIVQRTLTFKNIINELGKITNQQKNYLKMYEEEKSATAPRLQALEKQFNENIKGIDEKLVAKYNAVRKSKGGDAKDVVVPFGDNRCQGCFMDVPVAIANQIKTNGWAICEECGRIIYQA